MQESIMKSPGLTRYEIPDVRIFLKLCSNLICIIGTDGFFKYLSPAWEPLLGYSIKELLSTPPAELVQADDSARFIFRIGQLKKEPGEALQFTSGLYHKSGNIIWVSWNMVFDHEKNLLYCQAQDLTIQKHEKKILKEENVKLKAQIRQHEKIIQKETDTRKRHYARLRETTKERYRFGNIIGKSCIMQALYEQIEDAGKNSSPVIILGESGTGKEAVARTIHKSSDRSKSGFVPVNCGAIPEPLFESEFFGYKKGAFTGAYINKHGFFDLAHNGTLFLDEVGELDLNLQVKLLRALESGEYTPIGNNICCHADIRIISATNVDLSEQIEKNKIREDFFYRIHVIPITIPPLRDRKEDIPLLSEHFLKKFNHRNDFLKFSGKDMDILMDYSWPGNVRELQNIVQRYIATGDLNFFKKTQFSSPPAPSWNVLNDEEPEAPNFRMAIRMHERQVIMKALKKNCWHKEKTASMLGLPRRTFFRKLKQLDIHQGSAD